MDLTTALMSAFSAALIGSLHCITMCGPLASAACLSSGQFSRQATSLYLLGRLVSYTMMGALFGYLGLSARYILPVDSVQLWASLFIAVLAASRGLVILGVVPQRTKHRFQDIWRTLSKQLGPALPKSGLGLGLLTGVLPCGLLVAVWGIAAATLNPLHGALVMWVFVIATTPALLIPVIGGGLLRQTLLRIPQPVYGGSWVLLACWLAYRPWYIVTGCSACH